MYAPPRPNANLIKRSVSGIIISGVKIMVLERIGEFAPLLPVSSRPGNLDFRLCPYSRCGRYYGPSTHYCWDCSVKNYSIVYGKVYNGFCGIFCMDRFTVENSLGLTLLIAGCYGIDYWFGVVMSFIILFFAVFWLTKYGKGKGISIAQDMMGKPGEQKITLVHQNG